MLEPRLFTALSPAAAWDEVIQPWLIATSQDVRSRHPHYLVTPTRSLGYFFKARALEAGQHLLGVRFITPPELRESFTATDNLAQSGQLSLLLAAAAENTSRSDHDPAALVARAPETLLRALDQLAQAGWDPCEEAPPTLRSIIREYQRLLALTGLRQPSAFDRALPTQPRIARLLIAGFDAQHWPLWPLLAAATNSAEAATIVLQDPRDEARELDELWIGTWENTFTPAQPVAAVERPRPLAEVLQIPGRRETRDRAEVSFLVGDTPHELAGAILARVLHDLDQPDCTRLGLVFAQAGPLARLVAQQLADANIPHLDALGHPLPGPWEEPAWTAWLRVQQDRRIAPFLALLRSSPALARHCGGNVEAIANRLTRTVQSLLIDDLTVLAAFLATKSTEPPAQALAAALQSFIWLPERATFGEHLTGTLAAFEQLGWPERAAELTRLCRWQHGLATTPVSRAAWLRWLEAVLVSTRREREPAGGHPYARVHLLTYAQAEAQEWSHLIACDLNEGQWPPPWREDGWLAEPQMAALNAKLRPLNLRAIIQGGQGEGHTAMRAGHTWMLTPADERALALRQFLNTLENTSTAVTACACLHDASQPDRIASPSEYFVRLHCCARGQAVSPLTMRALHEETLRALGPVNPARPSADVSSVLRAWQARRDPSTPFGEYQFACQSAPLTVTLSATAWENALQRPAQVWLETFLGLAEPEEADANLLPAARGQWVHRWLAAPAPGGSLVPLPAAAEFERTVRASAGKFRVSVARLLADCGREVPDWWDSTWRDAAAIAATLARKIGGLSGWERCAAEWVIENIAVALPDGATLRLRGRVDLLLSRGSGEPGAEVWIIDHKTGDPEPLRLGKFLQGDGLQLGLYALAARAKGAAKVGFSRLGPSHELANPSLTEAALEEAVPVWCELAAMQDRGTFGQLGELRSEYGIHAVYPLATLAIDTAVLARKWKLTHPALAKEKQT
jgi:RecB family exonuclease